MTLKHLSLKIRIALSLAALLALAGCAAKPAENTPASAPGGRFADLGSRPAQMTNAAHASLDKLNHAQADSNAAMEALNSGQSYNPAANETHSP